MIRSIILGSFLILILTITISANTDLKTRIESDVTEVALDRTFTVTVTIECSLDECPLFFPPSVNVMENCRKIGHETVNKTQAFSNRTVMQQQYIYTLEPKALGEAYFGEVQVYYAHSTNETPRLLQTDTIEITVKKPVGNGRAAFIAENWLILLIAVCIGMGIGGGVMYYIIIRPKIFSGRKNKPAKSDITAQQDECFSVDAELKKWEKNDNNYSQKEQLESLEHILKTFIYARFKIPTCAREKLIHAGCTGELTQRICSLINKMDTARYAPVEVEPQVIRSFYSAVTEIIYHIHKSDTEGTQ